MSAVELKPAAADAEIAACFPVLRQLRPKLADAQELLARVRRQEQEGYRLLAAWEEGRAVGAAGYRLQENLIRGRFAYVDDLVVLESERRRAIGAALLDEVARRAKAAGCVWMTLDTGLDNALGQRFYFRCGMLATALHFGTRLA
jgi:GNAT superfamily N-acetyltransferase